MGVDRRLAVALGYESSRDRAPRLLAKGRGKLASRILEVAAAHQVPVEEDGDLARLLESVPLFEEIPPPLYPVVAEVLTFIYRANAKRREKSSGS